MQYYHAQDHANYKDHPEQDLVQLKERAMAAHSQAIAMANAQTSRNSRQSQVNSQIRLQAHAHALRPNPERGSKLGGFLRSKATRAKEALQGIWRKVTGKH